jgi:hypothetical protein
MHRNPWFFWANFSQPSGRKNESAKGKKDIYFLGKKRAQVVTLPMRENKF